MSTTIRPELSAKNRYWLPRHRYYELYHFCLQYPDWKKSYRSLDGFPIKSPSLIVPNGQTEQANPTAVYAEARLYYRERMDMVENAAKDAAADLYLPLLRAVTEGISYECLNTRENIPCGKDVWYGMYRRFFWLLDKARK